MSFFLLELSFCFLSKIDVNDHLRFRISGSGSDLSFLVMDFENENAFFLKLIFMLVFRLSCFGLHNIFFDISVFEQDIFVLVISILISLQEELQSPTEVRYRVISIYLFNPPIGFIHTSALIGQIKGLI